MLEPGLYRYDEGDLLEQRNSYFFSAFHGIAFLAAWTAKRDSAMGQAGPRPTPAETTNTTRALGQTDRWLEELEASFTAGSADAAQRQRLAKLIQRFEVSKRLHADYTPEFKPAAGADYKNLARYVSFAAVLVAAYRADPKLQTLNALLKLLDTLSALRQHLPGAAAVRLPELMLAEREFVADLADRLEVRWQAG